MHDGYLCQEYFHPRETELIKDPVTLKPKYYPHITILAAATMTVAPLCFVLSLPYIRDSGAMGHDSLVGDVPDTPVLIAKVGRSNLNEPMVADSPPKPESSAGDTTSITPPTPRIASNRDASKNETRVALLPAESQPSFAAVPELSSERPSASATHQQDAQAVIEMAAADNVSPTDSSELPVPIPAARVETESVSEDEEREVLVADASSSAPVLKMEPYSLDEATKPEPAQNDEPFVEPVVRPPSAFEATGHLSMAGGTTGVIGGTPKPVAPRTPPASAKTGRKTETTKTEITNTEPEPRIPRWKLNRQKEQAEAASMAVTGDRASDVNEAFAPGFGTKPPVQLEDVILQQPLENRRVSRMENLVAVTRAPGWPIALVRSDLPDDHWWVQQMVGIRGNAFAARVNFGNADSIAGSVYHLVIVFLDSPDEVRRFRIAKQFKELPEGVRRTREYTFVRR